MEADSACVGRESQFNNYKKASLTTVKINSKNKITTIKSLSQTSRFNFPNAYVHHHGSLRVVGLHERGEVTAVHFLDPLEIRLAVVGNVLGTLLVYVQSTVCKQRSHIRLARPFCQSPAQITRYQK